MTKKQWKIIRSDFMFWLSLAAIIGLIALFITKFIL